MNRRSFTQKLLGGLAAVGIGSKVESEPISPAAPKTARVPIRLRTGSGQVASALETEMCLGRSTTQVVLPYPNSIEIPYFPAQNVGLLSDGDAFPIPKEPTVKLRKFHLTVWNNEVLYIQGSNTWR